MCNFRKLSPDLKVKDSSFLFWFPGSHRTSPQRKQKLVHLPSLSRRNSHGSHVARLFQKYNDNCALSSRVGEWEEVGGAGIIAVCPVRHYSPCS